MLAQTIKSTLQLANKILEEEKNRGNNEIVNKIKKEIRELELQLKIVKNEI